MTPVLFIDELSELLGCKTRTIRRRIAEANGREPWNLPPRMPPVDKRHRWSRAVVEQWIASNGASTRVRMVR